MYKIEKRFTLPIGHRLSKHEGRCFSIHGHNFSVLVGLKSEFLNENDMIIDFSELKHIVNNFLDQLDHCLMLNENDKDTVEKVKEMGIRMFPVPFDPTAERLAKMIYDYVESAFQIEPFMHIIVDYVTVFENENSKTTFMKE